MSKSNLKTLYGSNHTKDSTSYFGWAVSYTCKMLIKLAPSVDTSVSPNKLECLSEAIFRAL